jgi:DNA-binding beta-propeller fold protein YncE
LYIVDSKGKQVPPSPSGLRTSKLRFLNLSNAAVTFYGSITVQPGEIKTIAGGSTDPSTIGDGEIATSAKLLGTTDVEVDPTTKDIYLSEAYVNNRRVRKILRSTGVISSLSLATNVNYTGLAFDNAGRLLIAAAGTISSQILRETGVSTGNFDVVTSSIAISRPRDIAVDSSNNLYVMNSGTQQILRLPIAGGTATNFAGTSGSGGFAGDGGNPTSAQIDIDPIALDVEVAPGQDENMVQTSNIIVTSTGEVIFADSKNNRIRRIR